MALLQKGVAIAAGRLPKVIQPPLHAVLDYAVAASFFVMGAVFWKRNKRAAISSLLCGGATAVNSILTDYPGGVYKVVSYPMHGRIDAGLAGITAAIPRVMSFADQSEAKYFSKQALAETAVNAMTDFDYYQKPSPQRLRRREKEGVA